MSSYFEQEAHFCLCCSVENRSAIPLSSMTIVECHYCLLNMHVTFDLSEIKEMIIQGRAVESPS